MARGLEENVLRQEWEDLKSKDWYSIYQWRHTCGVSYTEWIAEWILESFAGIRLNKDGLRTKGFRCPNHRGQADITNGKEGEFNEKRLVRAIFNLGSLPPLGEMIDYEVPLREPESTCDAKHGDIDLLCLAADAILCVEAKSPLSGESMLKAILQAFVYTSLATIAGDAFVADFDKLPPTFPLTPAILIFAGTAAYRQLKNPGKNLSALVRMLNSELAKPSLSGIRFFVAGNEKTEVTSWIRIQHLNGDKKPIFANVFTPNIVEWPNPI